MTDEICGATKRNGEDEVCKLPAGWGTEHVGEGRCKLHGGNAGAPDGNQNAAKHPLHADPHHYYQSLDEEQQRFIDELAGVIQDRIYETAEEIDHMDLVLSRRVAIDLHIVSKASDYIANESGLLQEVGPWEAPAPLLEEVRQYDESIFKNLKKLGVLDTSEDSDTTEWREFIADGAESGQIE